MLFSLLWAGSEYVVKYDYKNVEMAPVIFTYGSRNDVKKFERLEFSDVSSSEDCKGGIPGGCT